MSRELSPNVKAAVAKLFPSASAAIEERLRTVTYSERAHMIILAVALQDSERLEKLCEACALDERDVVVKPGSKAWVVSEGISK